METKEKQLRMYVDARKCCHFEKWLDGIKDIRARALVSARLNRIRLGSLGDCKSVGSGVLELRIFFGPGYRIYLGLDVNEIVILLMGGDKSNQGQDIAAAKEFWADYKRRKKDALKDD